MSFLLFVLFIGWEVTPHGVFLLRERILIVSGMLNFCLYASMLGLRWRLFLQVICSDFMCLCFGQLDSL